jgi:cytoskeletal protein CcmA (bactofilin family)
MQEERRSIFGSRNIPVVDGTAKDQLLSVMRPSLAEVTRAGLGMQIPTPPSQTRIPLVADLSGKPSNAGESRMDRQDLVPEIDERMSVMATNLDMRSADTETDDDLTIRGKYLDGRLKANKLVVAETAQVSGLVIAEHLRASGILDGKVFAKKMYVLTGGTLKGSLVCVELGVQPGSIVSASIEVVDAATYEVKLRESVGAGYISQGDQFTEEGGQAN